VPNRLLLAEFRSQLNRNSRRSAIITVQR